MGVLKRGPVIGADLFEGAPVPRGLCQHRVVPSWGVGMLAVQRFSHACTVPSTPHPPSSGRPQPPLSSLHDGDFRNRKMKFPMRCTNRCIHLYVWRRLRPTVAAMSVIVTPSASSKIIRARLARPADTVVAR